MPTPHPGPDPWPFHERSGDPFAPPDTDPEAQREGSGVSHTPPLRFPARLRALTLTFARRRAVGTTVAV